ncbi:hypothetical protein IWW57_003711 [Coemansia sp. S610]|nr:hypothetical protein IWW57_003711 [Coemansia sp. S610]
MYQALEEIEIPTPSASGHNSAYSPAVGVRTNTEYVEIVPAVYFYEKLTPSPLAKSTSEEICLAVGDIGALEFEDGAKPTNIIQVVKPFW